MKDFSPLRVFGVIIISALVGFLISTSVNSFITKSEMKNKVLYKIEHLTYKDVSTSIDERGRLHVVNFKDGTVTIFCDSVAMGINAQVSNIILKDFKEKTRW